MIQPESSNSTLTSTASGLSKLSQASDTTDSSTKISRSQQLIIRASAGTGKTFQLSSRYISILRNTSPEKILASTFTRKAAGEILDRVLLRLAKATQDEKAFSELSDSVGAPPLTRKECLGLLARLTRNLHRVRISTLDSFFSQLAGSYALELGLSAGWRMLDPLEIDQIRDAAILEMLNSGNPHDLVQLMHLLDKGQSTRNISRLITDTIQNLYYVYLAAPPESWDQFPPAIMLSLEQRLALQVQIQEYPLEKASLQKARDNDVAAINAEDWESLLKKGLMTKIISGEMTYSRVPIPVGLQAPYETLFTHVIGSLIHPWRHQNLAARQLLEDYHTAFEQMKLIAGGLEFGDVTRKLAAWQSQSQLSDSSFRLDASIEHLLLDEFQDTSPQQWQVIKSFAEEACSKPGRSFFCVGDTKQAIYGWRGGEAELFNVITQELPGSDGTATELNLSYRSSPVIMDTVNLAMRNLWKHDNFEDHKSKSDFPEHQTTRTALTGYACLRTLSDRSKKVNDTERQPYDPEVEEEIQQDYWTEVAEYVKARHSEAPDASIGILTRRNVSIGRLIFELNKLGIEASEEGGNPLTDSAVVQLILSLMTLADHPGNTIAAFHVASSPLGEIYQWREWNDTSSRVRFSEKLRRTLVDHGYGGLIHRLIPQLAGSCNRREYQRLLQLAEFADRYDVLLADLRPSGFVSFIEQQKKEEPTSAKVRVMSIHQSKGLEFDIVILPELDSQLYLPPKFVSSSSAPGEPPNLVALYRNSQTFDSVKGALQEAQQKTRDRLFQEALCLLYVALTRSARSLHLLISPKESKKHPKSFGGLLRAALASDVPISPQKILWELGDENWFVQRSVTMPPLPEPTTEEPSTSDQNTAQPMRHQTEELVQHQGERPSCSPDEREGAIDADGRDHAHEKIRFAAPTHSRHWKRTSATQQYNSQQRDLKAHLQPPATALQRGTIFHHWMQQIEWLQHSGVQLDQLLRQANMFGISADRLTKWAREFMEHCSSHWTQQLLGKDQYSTDQVAFPERIRQAIKSGRYDLKVRNEIPFAIRQSRDELLSGSIDRLVIVYDRETPVAADVIDFKSDQVIDSDQIQQRRSTYGLQLDTYRHAVQTLLQLPDDHISARLAFLHPQITLDA